MNKTKIPWCDYTVNPVKGLCPMACDYCYARRMYKRFKWNPEIRLEPCGLHPLLDISRKHGEQNQRIFVGSTIELFGEWVKPEWIKFVFRWVETFPEHTFIFLTKRPENLAKWSPFPKNCWVGVSAVNNDIAAAGCAWLSLIEATVKFLSIEPLLEWDIRNAHNGRLWWQENYHDINWLIIGSQTQPTKHIARCCIEDILKAADKAKIPVFVKEPMATHYDIQRKEFPSER